MSDHDTREGREMTEGERLIFAAVFGAAFVRARNNSHMKADMAAIIAWGEAVHAVGGFQKIGRDMEPTNHDDVAVAMYHEMAGR